VNYSGAGKIPDPDAVWQRCQPAAAPNPVAIDGIDNRSDYSAVNERIPINVMSMVPIMESVNILTFSL
jgi:hypothetical protein